jgi:hypothetical protein
MVRVCSPTLWGRQVYMDIISPNTKSLRSSRETDGWSLAEAINNPITSSLKHGACHLCSCELIYPSPPSYPTREVDRRAGPARKTLGMVLMPVQSSIVPTKLPEQAVLTATCGLIGAICGGSHYSRTGNILGHLRPHIFERLVRTGARFAGINHA